MLIIYWNNKNNNCYSSQCPGQPVWVCTRLSNHSGLYWINLWGGKYIMPVITQSH